MAFNSGWASGVVIIDDLGSRPHDRDLLLDQTLYQIKFAYEDHAGARTHFLRGPNFLYCASSSRLHVRMPWRVGNVAGAAKSTS